MSEAQDPQRSGLIAAAAALVARFTGRRTPAADPQAAMTAAQFSDWMRSLERGNGALSEQGARSISAVWACLNVIAGAIASMPLHFYKRDADGDRSRVQRPEWWLFNESPLPGWTASALWDYVISSRLLQGDAFVEILRPGRYSPAVAGLRPHHPSLVAPERTPEGLVYRVTELDAQGRRLPVRVVLEADMLHIPGAGFNGLRGVSLISSALATPGTIAVRTGEFVGSFFNNGARPDFALETDQTLKSDQIDTLRNQWSDIYGGATRAWKPAVLAGGLKIKPITMTSVDAQILETRRFNIEDIARVFGVPAFMIGHTDKTTSWGSGVAEMGVSFVKYTLSQHLIAIQQEVNRKLFPRSLQFFAEFATAGLERGDLKARNDAYRVALGRAGEPGWMTVNEVRRLENLPALDGADDLNGQAEAPDPAEVADEELRQDAAAALEARRVAAAERAAEAAMAAADAARLRAEHPPVVNVAAPVVNVAPAQVHNHLPETQVNVEAVMPQQAAPVVNVEGARVSVSPTPVNVAAPVINVEAVMPAVPPAPVQIVNEVPPAEVTVHLPDRITETTVTRDRDGNIVRTTQVETTKD
jgi:HK97 family phage portal protein